MNRPDTSARPQVLIGFLCLVILIAGLGIWGVNAKLTSAIVASGTVEVESNRKVVQHATGGIVEEIRSRDGQYVEAGEVLLALNTGSQKTQLAFAQAQLFELHARQDRLKAERLRQEDVVFASDLMRKGQSDPTLQAILEGQRQLFHATRTSIENDSVKLESRKNQIAAQIDGMKSQRAALVRQIELTGVALAKQRTLLERQLASAAAVLELEREEARLSGNLGELVARQAAAQERLVETDLEIMRIVTRHVEQGVAQARDLDAPIREYTRDAFALGQEIEQSQIRAPESGVIYGMRVHTKGAVLGAAEPILYVIPQDRPLIVAIRVSPTDIDLLAVGQEVKLRLSAFDQRSTPEVWGQVKQVSADAFEDENTGEFYFRAEMTLTKEALAQLPKDINLLPGMPVEAFIRTGAHSPLAYLMKPITDYFARALRES